VKIISHRGYWQEPEEKNGAAAFCRTFQLGFGTETDVRDLNGHLVISHDPATEGAMPLSAFLVIAKAHDTSLPLAINVKSDGLASLIRAEMATHGIVNWFVFDMSIPDMRWHIKEGNPVFTRMSEVERTPTWLDKVQGVWLDAFESQWYDEQVLTDLLNMGKKVCAVSPDLHRRPHLPYWAWLKERGLHQHDAMLLCTDHPEDARSYFKE